MNVLTLHKEQTHTGALILVNPTHPLSQTDAPDLIPIYQHQPDILLERRAAGLLTACIASVHGKGSIVPVSGWRSQAEQQAIWDDTMAADGEVFTRKYVAIPGCSEHQTGLAIDLGLSAPHIDFIRPNFPQDGICGSFRKAAASYGFIQRYRKEKETITTIAEEPWHFRYVGVPHAAFMEQNGLCLEEYRDFIHAHPRRLELPDGKTASVSHFSCPDNTLEIEIPTDCYQISGDNAGGFFLTVWGNLP